MDYSYSGACVGHRDYVRSVIALPNNYFASGSRDGIRSCLSQEKYFSQLLISQER